MSFFIDKVNVFKYFFKYLATISLKCKNITTSVRIEQLSRRLKYKFSFVS